MDANVSFVFSHEFGRQRDERLKKLASVIFEANGVSMVTIQKLMFSLFITYKNIIIKWE